MKFEKWQALGNDYLIVEHDAAAVGADAQAHRAHLRPAFRDRLRRDPAALADRRPGARRRRCGSSTRTARRPSSRATARARRSSTCAATAGPTRTSSRSRPPPGRSARRSPRRPTCAVDMGQASHDLEGLPLGGAEDGRGTLEARRPRLGLPARLDRQPAVRDRVAGGDSTTLDLTRDRPGDRERPALFPNRTNVSFWPRSGESTVRARIFERGVGETLSSGTGASGAAVAAFLRGRRSPITVELDGGELLGRDRRRPRRHA